MQVPLLRFCTHIIRSTTPEKGNFFGDVPTVQELQAVCKVPYNQLGCVDPFNLRHCVFNAWPLQQYAELQQKYEAKGLDHEKL